MGKVRFVKTNFVKFNAISKKDQDTLYFVSDEGKTNRNEIYLGSIPYQTDKNIYTTEPEHGYRKGDLWLKNTIDPEGKVVYSFYIATKSNARYDQSDWEGADFVASDVRGLIEQLNKKPGLKIFDEDDSPLGEIFNTYDGDNANIATGHYSHAEGWDTGASGDYSHAEGIFTTASEHSSHAEGYRTEASGSESHAEGFWTEATNVASHAEGIHTTASGNYSHAEGENTTASGDASHAEGHKTQTQGNYSHAEGGVWETSSDTTSGPIASGLCSHAEGACTTASGPASHAEGGNSLASGGQSHAEGYNCKATELEAHAEGGHTTASEQAAHAEGWKTTASGPASHAEGWSTEASGKQSHAEGYSTIASGDYSHAEGYGTTASKSFSHAEGNGTIASGPYSHAEGYNTEASGTNSHAGGSNTLALQDNSTVIGQYNSAIHPDSKRSYLVVGAGANTNDRRNAFRVEYQDTYVNGTLHQGSADYAEYFEWKDKNIENKDRRGLFVTLEEDKIRLANKNDEYILGIVSAAPAITGNGETEEWKDRYLKDIFGAKITDEEGNFVINPEYDADKPYTSRQYRKEWSPIGLLGQLVMIDDGTCIPGGYCGPGANGIATASSTPTNCKVIKRLDNTHIKVLIK